MHTSIFTCGDDIRIDHPFPTDDSMTALWAAHDCKDFDLLLTVMLDAVSEANLVGFVGAELSAKECVLADYWGEGVYACEYEILARAEPLGILFKGGFRPVFYSTEWTTATAAWTPAFNWW